MKATKGKANPAQVNEILRRKLARLAPGDRHRAVALEFLQVAALPLQLLLRAALVLPVPAAAARSARAVLRIMGAAVLPACSVASSLPVVLDRRRSRSPHELLAPLLGRRRAVVGPGPWPNRPFRARGAPVPSFCRASSACRNSPAAAAIDLALVVQRYPAAADGHCKQQAMPPSGRRGNSAPALVSPADIGARARSTRAFACNGSGFFQAAAGQRAESALRATSRRTASCVPDRRAVRRLRAEDRSTSTSGAWLSFSAARRAS